MAVSYTTTYNLTKPEVGASEDQWGGLLNTNLDELDNILDGTTPVTGIDINSGTIDGTVIGGSTPAAVTATSLTATGTTTLAGASTTADITFGDNDKAIFGAGSDLQIFHTGSYSTVRDVGTGALFLGGENYVDIGNAGASATYARFHKDAQVDLYHNNAIKLTTTSTGIDVTGTVTADGLTVNSGATNEVAKFISTDGTSYISIKDSTTSSDLNGIGTIGDQIIVWGGGTERMRIDSSGNLLVGKTTTSTTTQGSALFSTGDAEFVRNGSTAAFFNRLTNDGDIVQFSKDGTKVGSIASNANTLLQLRCSAASGYGVFIADGEDNKFGFVSGENAWRPAADNLFDLGTISRRYDDIYATNGTIQTSDRNEKQDIDVLSDAEQRVAVACKGLLRKFRWKDAVAEKGDAARIHFGIIAQDLQAAFEAEGLDAGKYAMFIHSTWTDEETGDERSRMGVRYSELLAFIIAAI